MREELRFEGLTLTVNNVEESVAYYRDKVKLDVVFVSLPAFALLKAGTGTIGLLSREEAHKAGAEPTTPEQRRGIHVEFSTEDLDGLYASLLADGIEFVEPPHDEPWERSMTALDPDGYSVEFAQGRRGAALAPKLRAKAEICSGPSVPFAARAGNAAPLRNVLVLETHRSTVEVARFKETLS